jgi:hypothetical protein
MLSIDKLSQEYNEAWLDYCKQMYEKNRQERLLWKEAAISYDEYVSDNCQFLKETFNN